MENTDIQDGSQARPQGEVANDVAMLFSWAKMENAPYRDFSRQRKAPPPAKIPVGDQMAAPADAAPEQSAPVVQQVPSGHVSPVVAVYSVAGGVGKTSLCANLGKTLCSLGEHPLLVDLSGRGLLPFYFGATDFKAGSRKFVAPGVNAPFVQVMSAGKVTSEWLEGEVKAVMAGAQRTIFDVGPLCGDLLPAIFSMSSVVLIPLLPDANSILTVAAIESSLNAQPAGSKPAVYYLFNRFDEHKLNDQHARDLVARQCGQRLLPLTLRHDCKLTEALHGDVSTADQTPGPELSHDYLELALWVRRIAPLRTAVVFPARWSEQ